MIQHNMYQINLTGKKMSFTFKGEKELKPSELVFFEELKP